MSSEPDPKAEQDNQTNRPQIDDAPDARPPGGAGDHAATSVAQPAAPQEAGRLPAFERPLAWPWLDRLLIFVLVLTVAATCLLISADDTRTKMGTVAWSPNSALRVVVELMAMGYEYPTRSGGEIKWLAQHLGAVVMAAVVAVAWFVRSRRDEEDEPSAASSERTSSWSRITPVDAAQLAMLGFVGWATLSSLWSDWPAASLGEGVRLSLWVAWAIALGRALSHRGTLLGAAWLTGVLAVTAAIGIWYHIERNPVMRLGFPIGNPIFFAACLLPGLFVAAGFLMDVLNKPPPRETGESNNGSGGDPSKGKEKGPLVIGDTPKWLFATAAIVVAVLLYAFHLADSRGPNVGFLAGAAVFLYLAADRRWRRMMQVGFLVLVLAGGWWFYQQAAVLEQGRGASLRIRFYAWQYAFSMFLEQPLSGHGQGTYLLQAQGMSRPDAERDRAAFAADLFGHAHNEWLQILAELGAIGIALYATAIGLTLWSVGLALKREDRGPPKWLLLALAAGLIGIMVEELSNVGLRRPGLPVVFYTVLGLIWAACRTDAQPWSSSQSSRSPAVRAGGLLVLLALSVAGSGLAFRDWQGARAEYQAMMAVQDEDWDEGIRHGETAATARLETQDRIGGLYQMVQASRLGAEQQRGRLLQSVRRAQAGEADVNSLRQLAQEDLTRFFSYFETGVIHGQDLLAKIPGYPMIAGWIADLWLQRQEMERVAAALEMQAEPGNYLEQAASWLQREYATDRLDSSVALRLFDMARGAPVQQRLHLLRTPLRTGPESPDVRARIQAGLGQVAQHPNFESVFSQMLQVARQALENPESSDWLEVDWYAPETVRLAGLLRATHGDYVEAANWLGAAVTLYYKNPVIRRGFPQAASQALLEQADYLLLGFPDDPSKAISAAEEAIEAWPPVANREQALRQARQELAFYQLAAGKEEAARRIMSQLNPELAPEQQSVRLGMAYRNLADRFLTAPVAQLPEDLESWVRHAIQLLPGRPEPHVTAFRFAVRTDDPDRAAAQLGQAYGLLDDVERKTSFVAGLLRQYPRNAVVREFAAERQPDILAEFDRLMADQMARLRESTTQTRPATAPATTSPAVPSEAEQLEIDLESNETGREPLISIPDESPALDNQPAENP